MRIFPALAIGSLLLGQAAFAQQTCNSVQATQVRTNDACNQGHQWSVSVIDASGCIGGDCGMWTKVHPFGIKPDSGLALLLRAPHRHYPLSAALRAPVVWSNSCRL